MPTAKSRNRAFRLAAISTVVAFAFHGLIDVSAHRLGTILPGILMASFSLPAAKYLHPLRMRFRRAWQVSGCILILFGILQNFAPSGTPTIPGFAQWLSLREQADSRLRASEFARALEDIQKALFTAPLDWRLYFQRASAFAGLDEPWEKIAADFRLARQLEPSSAHIPATEARYWADNGRPLLAIAAWRQSVLRDPRQLTTAGLHNVGLDPADPAVRSAFLSLAGNSRQAILDYLQSAPKEDFDRSLNIWLTSNPSLGSWTSAERRGLFLAWRRFGDLGSLAGGAREYPAWLPECWDILAIELASQGDFRGAFRMAHANIPPPILPKVESIEPLESLEAKVALSKSNYLAAYALLELYRSLGKLGEASSLAHSMAQTKGAPLYWYFIEAEILAGEEKWENAWTSLNDFMTRTGLLK